jgi:hypothetical protein
MQKLDMVSKGKLLILVLSVIAVVSLAIVYVHEFNPFNAAVKGNYKPGLSTEIDTMVGRAQRLYKDRKAMGMDFSTGPCLTNDLAQDWVADIVHNPREVSDNLAENQCPAFLEGRATHFVELDPEGEVVKVK